jgi:hypothetical protein
VDRIDNEGHYTRGNLRFVTQKEQVSNRRNTFFILWKGEKILASEWKENPYAQMGTVMKYAKQGLTGEEIIQMAWDAVAHKRKNWKGLKERLESMTS